jgi:hypothetical protein
MLPMISRMGRPANVPGLLGSSQPMPLPSIDPSQLPPNAAAPYIPQQPIDLSQVENLPAISAPGQPPQIGGPGPRFNPGQPPQMGQPGALPPANPGQGRGYAFGRNRPAGQQPYQMPGFGGRGPLGPRMRGL